MGPQIRTVMNRSRPVVSRGRPVVRLPYASLMLLAALCVTPPLAVAGAPGDCSNAQRSGAEGQTDPDCVAKPLAPFQRIPEAAPAAPVSSKLGAYDPEANRQREPGSPDVALTSMPAVFLRAMRLLATGMMLAGVSLMVARKWIRQRIRNSDEAALQVARRRLAEAQKESPPQTAPTPAPQRLRWTAERINALDDEDYSRLCAGYWETKGYSASFSPLLSPPQALIELHQPPDRKVTLGLVRFLAADIRGGAQQALQELIAERDRRGVSFAVLMSRRPLSGEAIESAGRHAVQVLDQAALLTQLGLLTQDQQEALVAELEAYVAPPSGSPEQAAAG